MYQSDTIVIQDESENINLSNATWDEGSYDLPLSLWIIKELWLGIYQNWREYVMPVFKYSGYCIIISLLLNGEMCWFFVNENLTVVVL